MSRTSNIHARLLWATLLLLLITLSRILIVDDLRVSQDEARSILRSFGTPAEIVAWQPVDWPPLYNLMLGGWQALIDAHPELLRVMSVLIFLPGAALTYQMVRKLFDSERAAWGTMIAYSALGYGLFLSTFLRGYVVGLALLPFLLLLSARYFERPSFMRAFWAALVIAGLYYTTYTSIFAFAVVGLYTLIVYGRALWRWWLPVMISFVMVLPDILYKLNALQVRYERASEVFVTLPPLPISMLELFSEIFGEAALVWGALTLVAIVLLVLRAWRRGQTWWALGWMLFGPLAVYGMLYFSIFYIYTPRYGWWGVPGLALVIGVGLAYLPRRVWSLAMVAMVALMFVPLDDFAHRPESPLPYEEVFGWLQDHVQPGDVMVIDPDFCIVRCGRGELWQYYFDYYLGNLIPVVDDPEGYRRVWHFRVDGASDADTLAAVEAGRIPGEWIGPRGLSARVYIGPPDPEGILYKNGMRFHGFEMLDDQGRIMQPPYDVREQTTAHLRLWWSVDHPLEAEYSLNTLIVNRRGEVVAEKNGPPQLIDLSPVPTGPLPENMMAWEPGRYYVEAREIAIPPLPTWYESKLYLIVYQWWDSVRIPADGTDDRDLLLLDDVLVLGW